MCVWQNALMILMRDKYLLFLFLLCALSCQREALEPDFELVEAQVEQLSPQSKADITDAGTFTWNGSDRIAVYYVSGSPVSAHYYTATLETGSGFVTAGFKLPKNGERDGFAIYPDYLAQDDFPGLGGSVLGMRLPEEYSLDTSAPTSENSPVPMVAVNTAGQKLEFKHAGALLRIKLSGVPDGTKYLVVSTNRNITGPFTVDRTDPDAPFIAVSTSTSAETYKHVRYTLSQAVAAGAPASITLNIPTPTGLLSNLCVQALDASEVQLGCINTGLDRLMERGRIRLLELDMSGAQRLSSFTVSPLTLPACGKETLSYSILQQATAGGTEEASGYTLSLVSLSVPDKVAVSISGTTISVTGITQGKVSVRLKAQKGQDVIYADVPITVSPTYLDIYNNSYYLYKNRSTSLKTRLVSGNQEVSYSGLQYAWTVVDGDSSVKLTASGSSATLQATDVTGTAHIRCSVSAVDVSNAAKSISATVEFEVVPIPNGSTGAAFSVSSNYKTNYNQVFFARANVYKLKSDQQFYLFERPWDACNGVLDQQEPDNADKMDCLDPEDVVTDFGDFSTSAKVSVDGHDTYQWFMLSSSQASYLLKTRPASKVGTTANARFVAVKVAGRFGILLFPDVFSWPSELDIPVGINNLKDDALDMVNKGTEGLPDSNCFTEEEWNRYLEPTGAVFLPGLSAAPYYFSYTRYSDGTIDAKYKNGFNSEGYTYIEGGVTKYYNFVYPTEDSYYNTRHSYFLSNGCMYFFVKPQTNNTYYIGEGTGVDSYTILNSVVSSVLYMDLTRFHHVRLVRYVPNKVI